MSTIILTDRQTDRQTDRYNFVNFCKNNKGLKALSAHADSAFCVLYE